jgi:uncharacterized flavoprotein (TIGR03862 family)
MDTPAGHTLFRADATLLALGGASWARLGSDGAWVPLLEARHVEVAPLQPANCGFERTWSAHFGQKFAGAPVKRVCARFVDAQGTSHERMGEFVITATGVEGSLIYAASAALREAITREGQVTLLLDLSPNKSVERLTHEIGKPRGARSMGSHLQSQAGIAGVHAGLLRELAPPDAFQHPAALAGFVKALPLTLSATRPIDEAISSAGGVRWNALNLGLMLHAMPGTFCAGEMLDWEAPTGGYLLTACFATGRAAGLGIRAWFDARSGKER